MTAHGRLTTMFGDEFTNMDDDAQALVEQDFDGASYDDQRDYLRNIGRGNLASYAECLQVQATRDARVKGGE